MKTSCQKCPERATLHITEIVDDGYVEIHLCHKCAKEYLTEGEAPAESASADAAADPKAALQCAACQITFGDFRATGRLGCPHDYEAFRAELMPLLENIHEGARHIGKSPRRAPGNAQVQSKLIRLRQELQQAIAVEDYERATQVRDAIKTLETGR